MFDRLKLELKEKSQSSPVRRKASIADNRTTVEKYIDKFWNENIEN